MDNTGNQYGYIKRVGNRVYYLNDGGEVMYVQGIRSLSIPFISLVNIPSLFINEVSVDFAINIKTQSSVETDSSLNVSGPPVNSYDQSRTRRSVSTTQARTTASSTSAASSKSDTSTESTYLVSMRAKHIDPPGLTALLLFMTSNKDTASQKMLDSNFAVVNNPSTIV